MSNDRSPRGSYVNPERDRSRDRRLFAALASSLLLVGALVFILRPDATPDPATEAVPVGTPSEPTMSSAPASPPTDFLKGSEIPAPMPGSGFRLDEGASGASYVLRSRSDEPPVAQVEITNYYQNAFPLAGWSVIGFGAPGAARRQVWEKDGVTVSVHSTLTAEEVVVKVNVCPPEPERLCRF